MKFLFHCEWLLETARGLGRRELTEDGENDHEEEQQQEDVHEGRQGLEDLPEVAGEEDRAEGREARAGRGPRSAVWASSALLSRRGPGAPDSHRALTPIVPWPVTCCLVLS